MPVSDTPLLERIARVLAGAVESSNADGIDPSAGEEVNMVWREHVGRALVILHTIREPDSTMAATGDTAIWSLMVDVALAEGERSHLESTQSVDVPPGAGTTGAE